MMLRPHIIGWALGLQRPPFVWLFRAYYWLAIQLSRHLVGRIEGVRSIYVSGSWTRDEVIYGLSDIDFKVLVAGDRNAQTYQAIRRRFALLRRCFPMLGPPDEKGIYFLDAFAADYCHYPLVQHLFDERFFAHRLVWGEDLLAALPVKAWNELDQGECAWARLRDWIERVHVLADCAELCPPQKQHLFFKAVCDVALLALRVESPELRFSRRVEILERISAEVEEPFRRHVGNLIREHEARYRLRLNTLDDDYQLFKKMVAICSERVARRDRCESSSGEIEAQAAPSGVDDDAAAGDLRGLSPLIRNVSVIRWPQVPLNPFDLGAFDAPAYVLDCAPPLDLQVFHALEAYSRRNLKNEALILLREYPSFVSAVDARWVEHWGSFPGSSDLVWRLLDIHDHSALTLRDTRRIEARTRAFQEQLTAVLSSPEFGRMDPSIFARFLFNALRVLIFRIELRHGRWQLPGTPADTVEFLIGQTGLAPAFPHRLAGQYECARRGAGFDERLVPKSRALLTEVLKIARTGGSWESLSTLNDLPDARYLNISVAVITANRPRQLERCLTSLVALGRRPEEVVIVDAGSDAAARQVVERLQAPFPIRFVAADRTGVARARNVAVRETRGEIIAFVDDDATVAPDWLERLERVFLRDPRVGLASGSVLNMDCGRRDPISRFMQTVEKM